MLLPIKLSIINMYFYFVYTLSTIIVTLLSQSKLIIFDLTHGAMLVVSAIIITITISILNKKVINIINHQINFMTL